MPEIKIKSYGRREIFREICHHIQDIMVRMKMEKKYLHQWIIYTAALG